jgi:hypothetical protein
MRTAENSTSSKKTPIASIKKDAKPLSKAKVNFIGTVPEAKGFTPQMRALILTASEAKKSELDSSSFTAQDLVALAVKTGNLTTGQDPLRIFRFYGKRLVDEGYFAKA